MRVIHSVVKKPRIRSSSCQYQCICKIWSNSIHSFSRYWVETKFCHQNEFLISIRDHNSLPNLWKLMLNKPNLDFVNINECAKFGRIPSICSQDIEWKRSWNQGMMDNLKTVYPLILRINKIHSYNISFLFWVDATDKQITSVEGSVVPARWKVNSIPSVLVCIIWKVGTPTLRIVIVAVIVWASSWENLSSGFATRVDSNRPA